MGLLQKTKFTRNEDINRQCIIVDAQGQRMGRLASGVAFRLMGKHRSDYSSHQNIGDFIIVTNLSKVEFTGKKLDRTIYYNHSLYPGGLKKSTMREKFDKSPSKLFMVMVKGMLPKGVLGRRLLENLRAYDDEEHSHHSQKPVSMLPQNLK